MSLPQVQLVLRGGVQEFAWALLLKGSLGSSYPDHKVSFYTRKHDKQNKSSQTPPNGFLYRSVVPVVVVTVDPSPPVTAVLEDTGWLDPPGAPPAEVAALLLFFLPMVK